MADPLTLLVVAVMLVIHALLDRKRRKPVHTCNPHTDSHRMGDMAVSYWEHHFDGLRDEMRETRVTQGRILESLTEIRTILQERLH